MTPRARPGLTLMEVLVALTILAFAAASWASFAGQGTHAMRLAAARDAQTRAAAQLLTRMSLWDRDRLAALGGRRWIAGFVVTTRPADPHVIEIAIADTTGRAVLRTSLYRPPPVETR